MIIDMLLQLQKLNKIPEIGAIAERLIHEDTGYSTWHYPENLRMLVLLRMIGLHSLHGLPWSASSPYLECAKQLVRLYVAGDDFERKIKVSTEKVAADYEWTPEGCTEPEIKWVAYALIIAAMWEAGNRDLNAIMLCFFKIDRFGDDGWQGSTPASSRLLFFSLVWMAQLGQLRCVEEILAKNSAYYFEKNSAAKLLARIAMETVTLWPALVLNICVVFVGIIEQKIANQTFNIAQVFKELADKFDLEGRQFIAQVHALLCNEKPSLAESIMNVLKVVCSPQQMQDILDCKGG